MLVVGIALAVVSGAIAQATANRNAPLPANSSIGNQRFEPGRPALPRRQGSVPPFGGAGTPNFPGVRGPNVPDNDAPPAN
jgi:hypothetical protein